MYANAGEWAGGIYVGETGYLHLYLYRSSVHGNTTESTGAVALLGSAEIVASTIAENEEDGRSLRGSDLSVLAYSGATPSVLVRRSTLGPPADASLVSVYNEGGVLRVSNSLLLAADREGTFGWGSWTRESCEGEVYLGGVNVVEMADAGCTLAAGSPGVDVVPRGTRGTDMLGYRYNQDGDGDGVRVSDVGALERRP